MLTQSKLSVMCTCLLLKFSGFFFAFNFDEFAISFHYIKWRTKTNGKTLESQRHWRRGLELINALSLNHQFLAFRSHAFHCYFYHFQFWCTCALTRARSRQQTVTNIKCDRFDTFIQLCRLFENSLIAFTAILMYIKWFSDIRTTGARQTNFRLYCVLQAHA